MMNSKMRPILIILLGCLILIGDIYAGETATPGDTIDPFVWIMRGGWVLFLGFISKESWNAKKKLERNDKKLTKLLTLWNNKFPKQQIEDDDDN